MNDWNKLQRDRGAIEALEELRDQIDSWRVSHLIGDAVHRDVLKVIGDMIADRK